MGFDMHVAQMEFFFEGNLIMLKKFTFPRTRTAIKKFSIIFNNIFYEDKDKKKCKGETFLFSWGFMPCVAYFMQVQEKSHI
jgi:hypothetical protein